MKKGTLISEDLLNEIFDELEKTALYKPEYKYWVKQTHQIIRKHFEAQFKTALRYIKAKEDNREPKEERLSGKEYDYLTECLSKNSPVISLQEQKKEMPITRTPILDEFFNAHLEQKNYPKIEVDIRETDVVMFWQEGKEDKNVLLLEKESIPELIKVLDLATYSPKKPLSEITDEDAILFVNSFNIGNSGWSNSYKIEWTKMFFSENPNTADAFLKSFNDVIKMFDFLQSKNYELPIYY